MVLGSAPEFTFDLLTAPAEAEHFQVKGPPKNPADPCVSSGGVVGSVFFVEKKKTNKRKKTQGCESEKEAGPVPRSPILASVSKARQFADVRESPSVRGLKLHGVLVRRSRPFTCTSRSTGVG